MDQSALTCLNYRYQLHATNSLTDRHVPRLVRQALTATPHFKCAWMSIVEISTRKPATLCYMDIQVSLHLLGHS